MWHKPMLLALLGLLAAVAVSCTTVRPYETEFTTAYEQFEDAKPSSRSIVSRKSCTHRLLYIFKWGQASERDAVSSIAELPGKIAYITMDTKATQFLFFYGKSCLVARAALVRSDRRPGRASSTESEPRTKKSRSSETAESSRGQDEETDTSEESTSDAETQTAEQQGTTITIESGEVFETEAKIEAALSKIEARTVVLHEKSGETSRGTLVGYRAGPRKVSLDVDGDYLTFFLSEIDKLEIP